MHALICVCTGAEDSNKSHESEIAEKNKEVGSMTAEISSLKKSKQLQNQLKFQLEPAFLSIYLE